MLLPSHYSRRSCVAALCLSSLVSAGPCDIYKSGGTPCVAAHSTTRALYSSYAGALYQVQRGSDGATADIAPVSAGGYANSAAQDRFCAGTTCVIKAIYDQSSHKNHLTRAPPGGFKGPASGGYDNLASATGAPINLNGNRVYGVFISPGTGYRNNAASGTAKGDAAQGIYAVLDGSHYNGGCCFDYGNAETSSTDTGNGHMETIYYGDNTIWGSGAGNGPWIMADLENGLFSGKNPKNNPANPSISWRLVTAIVKGTANLWAIRGGNAAGGSLSTFYSGARPSVAGYNPMSKEGAIILGIGGDNSVSGQGTFYEGAMVAGYPSDSTENAVQADIASHVYTAAAMNSGPTFSVGSSLSLRATTACCTTRYAAHNGSTVNTQVVTSSSSTSLKQQSSFIVRAGLAQSDCFSFESKDTPNSFLRHYNFQVMLEANDGSKQFGEDATFCTESGLNGQGSSIRSWNYPLRYLRHYDNVLYIASNGGENTFDSATSFNDDVSFVAGMAFA